MMAAKLIVVFMAAFLGSLDAAAGVITSTAQNYHPSYGEYRVEAPDCEWLGDAKVTGDDTGVS